MSTENQTPQAEAQAASPETLNCVSLLDQFREAILKDFITMKPEWSKRHMALGAEIMMRLTKPHPEEVKATAFPEEPDAKPKKAAK